ncbi:S-crystallin SL11-like [Saccoglossus kowalevskii]|uniref:S-crystallin SL11-like n=1 Tax=Saccoglossus kowalevskii TaxID=10224 RepID=A0ABM0GJX6_SACKO|nr:PREDICTED: S-crystallin SL11-like [Saccoglossus kowalevskii]
MPNYKLHYFNARGRAETSRFILALAGVKYEDKRYTGEEWGKIKASGKFPFGEMPVLEVDDTVLSQSNAIARYLASVHGYNGKNDLETAKIGMIVETFVDILNSFMKAWFNKDEKTKAELLEEFKTKTLTQKLAALEKLLVANNGGNGYFVGDKVSLADITFVTFYEMFSKSVEGALDKYPKLKSLQSRVLALPKIAEWVKKRPESQF